MARLVNTAAIRERIKPYLPSGNRMPKPGDECGAVRLSIYLDVLDNQAGTPLGKWSGAYLEIAYLIKNDPFYRELKERISREHEAKSREAKRAVPMPSNVGYREQVFDGRRAYTGD